MGLGDLLERLQPIQEETDSKKNMGRGLWMDKRKEKANKVRLW